MIQHYQIEAKLQHRQQNGFLTIRVGNLESGMGTLIMSYGMTLLVKLRWLLYQVIDMMERTDTFKLV